MRPLALLIIIFWFSRRLNLFWSQHPRWQVLDQSLDPHLFLWLVRSYQDIQSETFMPMQKSARRRWTHSRMSSRRWWWKTVSGQSSHSRICWRVRRWGLNWAWEKSMRSAPEGRWVLTISFRFFSPVVDVLLFMLFCQDLVVQVLVYVFVLPRLGCPSFGLCCFCCSGCLRANGETCSLMHRKRCREPKRKSWINQPQEPFCVSFSAYIVCEGDIL